MKIKFLPLLALVFLAYAGFGQNQLPFKGADIKTDEYSRFTLANKSGGSNPLLTGGQPTKNPKTDPQKASALETELFCCMTGCTDCKGMSLILSGGVGRKNTTIKLQTAEFFKTAPQKGEIRWMVKNDKGVVVSDMVKLENKKKAISFNATKLPTGTYTLVLGVDNKFAEGNFKVARK